MKIAVLTTVHPENDVRIYHKQAISISAQHEVTLIAPKKTKEKLKLENYIPLKNSKSRFSRLAIQKQAYNVVIKIRPDVIHLHDPELIFLGILLKLGGYKIVWDVHESLPGQVLNKKWIPRHLRRPVSMIASGIEFLAGKFFDRIIVATQSIGKSFPAEKTFVIQNFPILGEMHSHDSNRFSRSTPIFFHGGGLTEIRGIKEIIEAIYILNNEFKYPGILRLVGKFESAYFEDICRKSRGWKYVDYHEWVGREDLAKLLGSADAGVITFLPAPNHIDSQPNKIFEYMSASLPIIVSDFPSWKELIGSDEVSGLAVDPKDPYKIAQAMKYLIDNPEESKSMGERGYEKVANYFNWGAESEKLKDIYSSLQRTIK
ncbi:glycosyltransferase WbpH [Deinococcus seoulensis]|uniref:Glycosyltransferase WbpH n=1 Tax=Deinococcus seoulensis TaxID=1837379 RepID=A0ABQ2RR09_9DEIO|nr:glycosyltransferase family 4 protein [Deinococcus seoulensis]GGR53956.1 glycosyltransferase WbpH [Deinococcus seoulensis]